MWNNKGLKSVALFCVFGAGLLATPAIAGDRNKDRIDRWSDGGRYVVGGVYGTVGGAACAPRGMKASVACGLAAQRGGEYIYDRSRDFANRRGERLREFGRRSRERLGRRR